MKIVYAGPITVTLLAERLKFDRPFPRVGWGFPLGVELVCGLIKRGHHVSVIATTTPIGKDEVFHARGCDVYLVPEQRFTHMQYPTLFSLEMRGVRACIQKIKPDVVFAQWVYYNAYAALTSGYPTLVVSHDSPWRIMWTCRSLQSIVKAFYAQLFVFPRLRNVTTVSPYMVDELRRFNHYSRSIVVVPNGLKTDGSLDAYNEIKVRRKASTIVCVSQWDRRKNPKCLLRSFAMLRRRHSDWRLIVFGQGLDGKTAGRWMRRHGVPDNGIDLRGQAQRSAIDDVIGQEADVFCSPSLEESFGMVFVEAMLKGVPCVGGEKSGAVPWVMGAGGVTCDVTKPEALAGCLERVMLDYELRKKLGSEGIRRVKQHFDIEHVVDLYEHELTRLAQERE